MGALVTMASRSIIAGEADRLDQLLPDFVEFSLTPYLGAEEAHRLSQEDGRSRQPRAVVIPQLPDAGFTAHS